MLSVKYQSSKIPSGGLEIQLILKFNQCKSLTYIKAKQFVNELGDYEFTGDVNMKKVKMRKKYRQ